MPADQATRAKQSVASVQHRSTATVALLSEFVIVRSEARTLRNPVSTVTLPLCKQGVTGSSPVGSTASHNCLATGSRWVLEPTAAANCSNSYGTGIRRRHGPGQCWPLPVLLGGT